MADPTTLMDLVDEDTLQGIRNKWKEDATGLPALFDELPESGRLKSPQPALYCLIKCALEKREPTGTSGTWYDQRRLTFEVRGPVKADVVAALGLIGQRFNLRTELEFPSGAHFLRYWPDHHGQLAQDPATKDGHDVWLGTMGGYVRTVRAR